MPPFPLFKPIGCLFIRKPGHLCFFSPQGFGLQTIFANCKWFFPLYKGDVPLSFSQTSLFRTPPVLLFRRKIVPHPPWLLSLPGTLAALVPDGGGCGGDVPPPGVK